PADRVEAELERVGPHEEVRPERKDHEEEQQIAPPRRAARDEVGDGIGDRQADRRRHEGDPERTPEEDPGPRLAERLQALDGERRERQHRGREHEEDHEPGGRGKEQRKEATLHRGSTSTSSGLHETVVVSPTRTRASAPSLASSTRSLRSPALRMIDIDAPW